jgi:hypothetical protein
MQVTAVEDITVAGVTISPNLQKTSSLDLSVSSKLLPTTVTIPPPPTMPKAGRTWDTVGVFLKVYERGLTEKSRLFIVTERETTRPSPSMLMEEPEGMLGATQERALAETRVAATSSSPNLHFSKPVEPEWL